VKLRRCVRMVEDRGDQIAGVNAAKVRGSNERSPARSADIDLERCRVAAGGRGCWRVITPRPG